MENTTTIEALEDRLVRRFREKLGVEVPAPELDLLETGVVDSLTFVELLVLIEDEFGTPIDIAELDLEDFRSVRRIARFLSARRGADAA